ncbi:hypothetical protein DIPPA_00197 [Diplonema papillatum]|nr:hypothetical protein DIPPA_00197 [Diplonema papillatum]
MSTVAASSRHISPPLRQTVDVDMRQKVVISPSKHVDGEQMAADDDETKARTFITLRDLIARLKYSHNLKVIYMAAVVVAAVLLLAAFMTDQVHSGWYIASEFCLTLLFACEVVIQMWITGPSKYLHTRGNVVELVTCILCCTIFGLSVTHRYARLEIEAALLACRYSAQVARLYFFIKSQRNAPLQRKVILHECDNPAISLSGHAQHPLDSAWGNSDDLSSELLKDIV